MKKGILQRAAKNLSSFEEKIEKPNPINSVKNEIIVQRNDVQFKRNLERIVCPPNGGNDEENIFEAQSMIAIRKDYSKGTNTVQHKSNLGSNITDRTTKERFYEYLGINKKSPELDAGSQDEEVIRKRTSLRVRCIEIRQKAKKLESELKIGIDKKRTSKLQNNCATKKNPTKVMKSIPTPKLLKNPPEINRISCLERIDYLKKPEQIKKEVVEHVSNPLETRNSRPQTIQKCHNKNAVHIKNEEDSKVIENSQNINKINNKINIIFKLNDKSKCLRKNLILRRSKVSGKIKKNLKESPRGCVKKSEAISKQENLYKDNNKIKSDKEFRTIATQTEDECKPEVSTTKTEPDDFEPINSISLQNDITEHIFFDKDTLIVLQHSTISFYEFDSLGYLLKGMMDFKLIEKCIRRLHDEEVDVYNKDHRLCANAQNTWPIYLEMRAKQKLLDDPNQCPIAFLYCNIYYIDNRRVKFSSVHLDTVKSMVNDIVYTTIPQSSYFIVSWQELRSETNKPFTGLCKYNLTPNLDLAKLASIRQFPHLNYKIRQMTCIKDSKLVTLGDTEISLFNYVTGDLLMSLDLIKSYGTNLTTFLCRENYLFMVRLNTTESPKLQRINVICFNKYDGNTFKVVHTELIPMPLYERIISCSTTSTNHLITTFSNGCTLMVNLSNFREIHGNYRIENSKNVSFYATGDHILKINQRNIQIENFASHFMKLNYNNF